MTRSEIDEVLERVRSWPLQRQEDAVHTLLAMEETGLTPYVLTPEEEAEIEEGERSGLASDEEVETFFRRYKE